MDVPTLQTRVEEHFRSHARAYGLEPEGVRAEYLLNWGGFVNASFRVSDGRSRHFLKLTSDPSILPGLRLWRTLHRVLEERYHAPRIREWVELPDTSYEGLLFEWIEGTVPQHLRDPLAGRVLPVIARLHRDAELAGHLPATASRCADTYLQTLHERFTEDLRLIEAERPAFVSEARLDWMRQEVDELEGRVTNGAAFQEPGEAPIHADLWANNFLVTAQDEWFLLDWDGLRRGDPALDWATLLGPSPADLTPLRPERHPEELGLDAAMRERLRLYARATLLDWIIDPLADWIVAGVAPDHLERVRAEKERLHHAALARYRALYP